MSAKPAPGEQERQIAASRERAAKAPPLDPAAMQRLAAILRGAGWGRRPAPAPGDGNHDPA
jgi:hypothetical protein